jgi:uncharacterized protein
MKEIIKKIITDFVERILPEVKEREIDIPVNSGKVVSIVGARRTGKTFLLYKTITGLRESIPSDRIIYFNFEDDRIFPASLETMNLFLESYYELFPNNKSQKVYFFFDEVQEIEKWELFIRRIYDNENCAIFITGSSSKLLIKEISSALRGRSISYELFPLSFREYLFFKKIDVAKYSSKSISLVINSFNEYYLSTAFPELINMDIETRRKSLNEYLDLIIYKDVVEKYNVSNIHLMKYLIKFLFSNSANLISINKIYNELKSSGLKISRNSVYEYISYLEDSYTIFALPIYTRNLRERQRNPQKFYALDTGLRMAMTISEDKGKLLESTVFMELRRQTKDIFYYFSAKEVDFIREKENRLELINVCYELNSLDTREREISSLLNAMNELKVEESFLLTIDEEGEEIVNNKKINILPVWKWLLETGTALNT